MNIRQEVEKALLAFASSQTPKIPIAFEGVAFTKPLKGPYLEIVFLEPAVINPTIDVTRVRKFGVIQIMCFVEDGKGLKELDALTEAVAALFPVHQKQLYTTFTVEQTPSISGSMPEDRFRCAVVRVKYRQEL